MGKIITVKVVQPFIDNECGKITRRKNDVYTLEDIERVKYLVRDRKLVVPLKIPKTSADE